MTKAKAIKLMQEYSRDVVEPAFASKITQAFGFKLSDLGIKAQKVADFPIVYSEEAKNLKGVAMYHVAGQLANKITGKLPHSHMNGRGSMADDIVSQAVELLS